ncbi:MAG TPA: hypothetical protein VFI91_14095 [Longimicrobiaceae bacterium]|nr:hypothetical protein [Longimicrobiaceae bacterium]
MICRSPWRLSPLGLICILIFAAGPRLVAQEVGAGTVRVNVDEENLRAAPGGAKIGVVLPEARLAAGPATDNWRPVTLSGWIPATAVRATSRDGYTLVVGPSGGSIANAPDGQTIARAPEGLLLNEVERSNGWVHVTRSAWMWNASLSPAALPEPAAAAPESYATNRELLATPGGESLATLAPGTELTVVERQGDWARVRMDGWILAPDGDATISGPLTDLSLSDLKEAPARYRGRELVWKAQFVSLQQADTIRVDLQPGEWYMLARDPNGEPGFVYVVVPERQLAAVRRLYPLQRFTLHGRIRTGSSELTGHPVIDLLEVTPANP